MQRIVILNEVNHLACESRVPAAFMGCILYGGQILRFAQDGDSVLLIGRQ